MKKIFVFAMVLMLPFVFAGCGKSDAVLDNMSERTSLYFAGNAGADRASISVGERENPYIKDGKHQSTCAYSLICLNVEEFSSMRLTTVIEVNGKSSEIELELVGGTYMYDLEYKLKAEDEVKLSYNDVTMTLTNVSANFGVDGGKAIEIGRETLAEKLKEYDAGEFECYVRVLGELDGESGELFWCFSVVTNDGRNFNVILSVKDGNVIAKD